MTIRELCNKTEKCKTCSFYDACELLDCKCPFHDLDEKEDKAVTRSLIETAKRIQEGEMEIKFKQCPFCGSKNIGVKDKLIDRVMGNDTPSSAIRKVWAYCRHCGCEGRKRVGDFVYDSEIIAKATESWNDRSEVTE